MSKVVFSCLILLSVAFCFSENDAHIRKHLFEKRVSQVNFLKSTLEKNNAGNYINQFREILIIARSTQSLNQKIAAIAPITAQINEAAVQIFVNELVAAIDISVTAYRQQFAGASPKIKEVLEKSIEIGTDINVFLNIGGQLKKLNELLDSLTGEDLKNFRKLDTVDISF